MNSLRYSSDIVLAEPIHISEVSSLRVYDIEQSSVKLNLSTYPVYTYGADREASYYPDFFEGDPDVIKVFLTANNDYTVISYSDLDPMELGVIDSDGFVLTANYEGNDAEGNYWGVRSDQITFTPSLSDYYYLATGWASNSLYSEPGIMITEYIDPYKPQPDQVARLYQAAFDRSPDFSGLNYWIDQSDHFWGLTDIAYEFVASAEFANLYQLDNPVGFITDLYHNALGRTPDLAGVNYWLSAYDAGLYDYAGLLVEFSESAENQMQTYDDFANLYEFDGYWYW